MIKSKVTNVFVKTTCMCLCLVMIFAIFMSPAASASISGYTDGRIAFVSTPDDVPDLMEYVVNGEVTDKKQMQWEEGRNGKKALSLNGDGQIIRLKKEQIPSDELTFSSWFFWRGDAEGKSKDSKYSQRYFTMYNDTGSHGQSTSWFTFKPHAKDLEQINKQNGALNGVQFDFQTGSGNKREDIQWNNANPDGSDSYGLPENSWHHIAMAINFDKMSIYIDGNLWFESPLLVQIGSLLLNYFTIGGGLAKWEEPTLNALIQDAWLYDTCFDASQIKMLYNDINPLDKDAAIPKETDASLPTAAVLTGPTVPGHQIDIDEYDPNEIEIPQWIIAIVAGLLILFVTMLVFANVYPKPLKAVEQQSLQEDDEQREDLSHDMDFENQQDFSNYDDVYEDVYSSEDYNTEDSTTKITSAVRDKISTEEMKNQILEKIKQEAQNQDDSQNKGGN